MSKSQELVLVLWMFVVVADAASKEAVEAASHMVAAIASKYHCTTINLITNHQPIINLHLNKIIASTFFTRAIQINHLQNPIYQPNQCSINVIICPDKLQQVRLGSGNREKWIFINYDGKTNNNNLFENVKIAFDAAINILFISNETVEIIEAFQNVRSGPVLFRLVAQLNTSLSCTRTSSCPIFEFFQSRNNFGGAIFNAGMQPVKPSAYLSRNADGSERSDGLLVDVLKALTFVLNFQFNVSWHTMGTGERGTDGSWTGLLGLLNNRTVDLVVSMTNYNVDRVSVIDFPGTILRTRFLIYVQVLTKSADIYLLLEPLPNEVWQALLGWSLIIGLLLTGCAILTTKFTLSADNPHPRATFIANLYFVLQALCQQASSWVPTEWIFRVGMLMVYITTAVIVPTYSASLISSLTLGRYQLPFHTLQQLAMTDYKVIIAGSGDKDVINRRRGDARLVIGSKNIMPFESKKHMYDFYPYLEQLRLMCESGSGSGRKLAVLADEASASYSLKMDARLARRCHIAPIPDSLHRVHQTFVLRKNSPYTNSFKHAIMQLREFGILRRFKNRHWPPRDEGKRAPLHHVTLSDVAPIFYIYACALLLSLLLLFAEIYSARAYPLYKVIHFTEMVPIVKSEDPAVLGSAQDKIRPCLALSSKITEHQW